MQCFVKKKDESLLVLEIENVETTGVKVFPSELTNTIELFIGYVHRNEAHFTCI